MSAMIEMKDIDKTYMMGEVAFEALKKISLRIEAGEFISIMGPSGSGKSTLLNILGCLDTPTGGSYLLEEKDVAGLNLDQLSTIRNHKIGFVFQNFNLLPYATTYENVELPMLFNGKSSKKRRQRVLELLEMVGLVDWQLHRPSELSGGQQQRVAIARALANDPSLILADEPTGNLDSKTGVEIMGLFVKLQQEGRTILMVTHDVNIAAYSQRTINLLDGRIL
jgi:putative ABC transport system ATP-binding protein